MEERLSRRKPEDQWQKWCLVRRRLVRRMESKHHSRRRSPFARQLWHLAINIHPSPSLPHHTSSQHTSIDPPPHHLETKRLATPSAFGRPFPHSHSFLPPKPQTRLSHATTTLSHSQLTLPTTMVKRKNQSGGEGEPVRKAQRTLLPKPDPHSINTQPPLPFPAARSRTRTQDLSSIEFTATLLTANGSHEEWFLGDGKVTAPRAEAKSASHTPSQQQSW